MKRNLYVLLTFFIGLLVAYDAFGPANLEVNVAALVVIGLLMVGLNLTGSVGMPAWSATHRKAGETSIMGVEAMATWVKDAAAGGYGSRIKIATVLSTSYAVNVGGVSDRSLIPTRARELVDQFVKDEPWAEGIFRPDPAGQARETGRELKGGAYLTALENVLTLVEKRA
jgi:hypothetical protein